MSESHFFMPLPFLVLSRPGKAFRPILEAGPHAIVHLSYVSTTPIRAFEVGWTRLRGVCGKFVPLRWPFRSATTGRCQRMNGEKFAPAHQEMGAREYSVQFPKISRWRASSSWRYRRSAKASVMYPNVCLEVSPSTTMIRSVSRCSKRRTS